MKHNEGEPNHKQSGLPEGRREAYPWPSPRMTVSDMMSKDEHLGGSKDKSTELILPLEWISKMKTLKPISEVCLKAISSAQGLQFCSERNAGLCSAAGYGGNYEAGI